MNRVIKFRAWTGTRMETDIMAGYLGAFYVPGLNAEDTASMTTFNTIYSDQTPVMQFTGLTDKNGKEIYEGDIPEEYTWIGWCSYCVGYQPFYKYEGKDVCHRCDGNYELADIVDDMKVIGNIYENPELLAINLT